MLEGIDVFVRVMDAGGFSAAAKSLGRSTSYVSKEVTRLEARLGVRLLNRTTRSISLTDEGRRYFESCRQIVADAEEAALGVTGAQSAPSGLLKVSAPVSFGLGHLAGVLPEFLKEHPAVTLEIDVSDRMVDVVAEGYDVVLRIGSLQDSSLIARRINTARGLTVASPAYWARHGKPQRPTDLAGHACICYSLARMPHRWDYVGEDGKSISIEVAGRVDCNSAELECALAVAGVGVTRLPEFACAREVAEGRLEPVLQEFARPSMGIYAVYPHRRHMTPKLRAFVDFLVAKFGDAACGGARP